MYNIIKGLVTILHFPTLVRWIDFKQKYSFCDATVNCLGINFLKLLINRFTFILLSWQFCCFCKCFANLKCYMKFHWNVIESENRSQQFCDLGAENPLKCRERDFPRNLSCEMPQKLNYISLNLQHYGNKIYDLSDLFKNEPFSHFIEG